jgi:hypothetical protein
LELAGFAYRCQRFEREMELFHRDGGLTDDLFETGERRGAFGALRRGLT